MFTPRGDLKWKKEHIVAQGKLFGIPTGLSGNVDFTALRASAAALVGAQALVTLASDLGLAEPGLAAVGSEGKQAVAALHKFLTDQYAPANLASTRIAYALSTLVEREAMGDAAEAAAVTRVRTAIGDVILPRAALFTDTLVAGAVAAAVYPALSASEGASMPALLLALAARIAAGSGFLVRGVSVPASAGSAPTPFEEANAVRLLKQAFIAVGAYEGPTIHTRFEALRNAPPAGMRWRPRCEPPWPSSGRLRARLSFLRNRGKLLQRCGPLWRRRGRVQRWRAWAAPARARALTPAAEAGAAGVVAVGAVHPRTVPLSPPTPPKH